MFGLGIASAASVARRRAADRRRARPCKASVGDNAPGIVVMAGVYAISRRRAAGLVQPAPPVARPAPAPEAPPLPPPLPPLEAFASLLTQPPHAAMTESASTALAPRKLPRIRAARRVQLRLLRVEAG